MLPLHERVHERVLRGYYVGTVCTENSIAKTLARTLARTLGNNKNIIQLGKCEFTCLMCNSCKYMSFTLNVFSLCGRVCRVYVVSSIHTVGLH